MPYAPFFEYFPEIAEKETRSVMILASSPYRLPPGEYGLLELFCDEVDCDCRRVFLFVVTPSSSSPEAVVAYGWESREFYVNWAGEDLEEVVEPLMGPVLNLASPQSARAPEILRLIKNEVLRDAAYVERLKKHYALFRSRIAQPRGPKRRSGKP